LLGSTLEIIALYTLGTARRNLPFVRAVFGCFAEGYAVGAAVSGGGFGQLIDVNIRGQGNTIE
jgi:hypothetical protein